MFVFVFIAGFFGAALTLASLPLYVAEVRNVIQGPEYTRGAVGAHAILLAFGLTLLGVMIWLSLTL